MTGLLSWIYPQTVTDRAREMRSVLSGFWCTACTQQQTTLLLFTSVCLDRDRVGLLLKSLHQRCLPDFCSVSSWFLRKDSTFFTCDQNVSMWFGLPLNRMLSRYIWVQSYRVECGLHVKPPWKKVSRVKGGWGLHTIGQLYWQEVGQLCPHIPSTDVWQGKYFHSWRGKGGKWYVLQYITVEVVTTKGENPRFS